MDGWRYVDRFKLNAEEDGLSLVEMLVAILLLALIMGAMARTVTTSLINVRGQELNVLATGLLQESMEAVAGVPWDEAVLCETPAVSHFGGPTYSFGADTESLVLAADADTICTSGAPIVPTQTVVRRGTNFDVETVIAWNDDPQDDVAGSDPNSAQDLKHVQVTISWTERGEAREVVNETYLAPNALEQDFQTKIEHAAGATYTYLDDDNGWTLGDVYLRLFAVSPQQAVSVTWPKSDGALVTRPMVNSSSDGVTWTLLIPNGNPSFTINTLANGQTLFRFKATDPKGVVTTLLDRGLFLIEQDGHEYRSMTSPSTLELKADGTACPFVVTADVDGALESDLVSATWTTGPAETALEAVGSDNVGAQFRTNFAGRTGFVAGATTLTVSAERIADGHVISATRNVTVVQLGSGVPCS